jgi:hypothetical protein
MVQHHHPAPTTRGRERAHQPGSAGAQYNDVRGAHDVTAVHRRRQAVKGANAKQGSISFLKKRNKKLLFIACSTYGHFESDMLRQKEQKFLGSFFQKRTTSLAFLRQLNS